MEDCWSFYPQGHLEASPCSPCLPCHSKQSHFPCFGGQANCDPVVFVLKADCTLNTSIYKGREGSTSRHLRQALVLPKMRGVVLVVGCRKRALPGQPSGSPASFVKSDHRVAEEAGGTILIHKCLKRCFGNARGKKRTSYQPVNSSQLMFCAVLICPEVLVRVMVGEIAQLRLQCRATYLGYILMAGFICHTTTLIYINILSHMIT